MIELAGVRLERPRAPAPLFAGVDLSIARGEVVLVTGGAGAGTSTLVAALLGEIMPAEGTISLFGRDLARLRRSSLLALRRRLGVVPQDLQLLPECTSLANVELPLEIDHVPRRDANARAAAALARLGLADHASALVGELSLAEQQRVAIARALVRTPTLLLADQPTSHQDREGAMMIAAALQECATQGAAVFVISRDPDLIAAAGQHGWRQLMVHRGRLVDVTDLVTVEIDVAMEPSAKEQLAPVAEPARAATGDDVPAVEDTGEIVIDVEPSSDDTDRTAASDNLIEFPAVARSRGAR